MIPITSVMKNINYSLRRFYIDNYLTEEIQKIPKEATILDLGGDKINKRGQFDISKWHSKVIYLNLLTDKMPDIVADGTLLPVKEKCFDVVICTEVLEHVPYPHQILAEIARVLKSGGNLLLTAPFLYHIHAHPYDYGRYTDTYWIESLNSVGFETHEITKHGLYFSVMIDNWRQAIKAHKVESIRGRIFVKLNKWIIPKLVRSTINYEDRNDVKANEFYNRYTTGFGIKATLK